MPRAKSVGSNRPKKKKNVTRRVKSTSPESNLLKKLFDAVNISDLVTVRRLVEHGALHNKDIQKNQRSEARLKSSIAHFSIIKIFHGGADGGGNREDAVAIFRILRDAGLEYSKNTVAPELFVSTWQELEVFEELINNGYDINTQHFRGQTVLIETLASAIRDDTEFTQEEYAEFINYLFDLGADINIQNENGLDALMIAAGHEAIDEFWFYLFGGGLGNEIEPKPYYVELLLDNLRRTSQRYNFDNSAQNGDDFNADEFTLEEGLENFRREAIRQNNDTMQHAHAATVELIREYKLALNKPTKSARFGGPKKPVSKSRSKSNSRSRSRSRSSGASEGGKKKTKKR